MLIFLLSALSAFAGVDPPETQIQILQFEATGWDASDSDHVHGDAEVVHSGERALRLESTEGATFITRTFPIRFEGKRMELRGFLKTEGVTGHAGLWLREDGSEQALEFDNMKSQKVKGTRDWAEYRVELPLHPDASEISFGAIVVGEGQIWVDDLQLLVDGQPVWDAPIAEHLVTVLDKDTAFDGGSEVDLSGLTQVQHDNLFRLGKVWGFLKYHHPKPRRGELHWDYELFRILPAVLEAEDTAAGQQVLADWVEALGEAPPCDPCATLPQDLQLPVEVDWIADAELLGSPLSAALQTLHERRPASGEQFYVGLHPGVGNPDFSREVGYGDLEALDTGYRLLAVFRFWNIIAYWYPYRDLIDADWDAVLRRALAEAVEAREEGDFARAMISMIAEVDDTHTNLWSSLQHRPPYGDCQVAARVRFVQDERAVLWSLPDTADAALQQGDVIMAIDGVPVAELVEAWSPLYAASNRPTRLRDIGRRLLAGPCGPTALQLERAGEAVEVEVERVAYEEERYTHDREGEAFQILDGDIAYLKLGAVEGGDIRTYLKRAKKTAGWVLDLRNYPSDFVVFSLGQHLVAQPSPFATFTMGSLDNPSAFRWEPPASLKPKGPRYTAPIAILVDETTQSSAEYHTMAFRTAPGAKVFGSTTAAADGDVSAIPLPGPYRTMITGIGVFYPDQTPTQRVGIVPDVEVLPTVDGIRAGRDEVIEAALEYLRSRGD